MNTDVTSEIVSRVLFRMKELSGVKKQTFTVRCFVSEERLLKWRVGSLGRSF